MALVLIQVANVFIWLHEDNDEDNDDDNDDDNPNDDDDRNDTVTGQYCQWDKAGTWNQDSL